MARQNSMYSTGQTGTGDGPKVMWCTDWLVMDTARYDVESTGQDTGRTSEHGTVCALGQSSRRSRGYTKAAESDSQCVV